MKKMIKVLSRIMDLLDMYIDLNQSLNITQMEVIYLDLKCIVRALEQQPKTDVLDKIMAEIIQMPTISSNANDIYKADVLAIIDKYKAEREDENDR